MMGIWRLAICAVALPCMAFAMESYTKDEIIEIAQDYGIAPEPLMVQGDIEYGEYLSGECTTCHQNSGEFDGIPVITQWDELYFKLAMHEYKQKTRENPVMQLVAGRLGDEEIAALAAYFAQIKE
jgi:cytochrome c